MKTNLPRINYD